MPVLRGNCPHLVTEPGSAALSPSTLSQAILTHPSGAMPPALLTVTEGWKACCLLSTYYHLLYSLYGCSAPQVFPGQEMMGKQYSEKEDVTVIYLLITLKLHVSDTAG